MSYVADVYTTPESGIVIAAQTPLDGIANNILLGSRFNDAMYGEFGLVFNDFYGLRGDDVMYGGGNGSNNEFIGGGGVDIALIAAPSYQCTLGIDYQGGVGIQRPDGGFDYANSETEIIQFSNGFRLLTISGGSDDSAWGTTWLNWHPGDSLALGVDWILAYYAGAATIVSVDANQDGHMDTALLGAPGVNTYVLLGYDQTIHTPTIVGTFGQGAMIDLN